MPPSACNSCTHMDGSSGVLFARWRPKKPDDRPVNSPAFTSAFCETETKTLGSGEE